MAGCSLELLGKSEGVLAGVSYLEFLDIAWPLIKLKSSSKVLGKDMGSRGGSAIWVVGQA